VGVGGVGGAILERGLIFSGQDSNLKDAERNSRILALNEKVGGSQLSKHGERPSATLSCCIVSSGTNPFKRSEEIENFKALSVDQGRKDKNSRKQHGGDHGLF